MPLIQIGPQRFLDEKIVRQYGIPTYKPPQKAVKIAAAVARAAGSQKAPQRPAEKAPAKPAARYVVPRRTTAADRAKTIPEAMAAGLTNDQIHQRLASGRLQNIKSVDSALRAWWKPADVREATRRGLIY